MISEHLKFRFYMKILPSPNLPSFDSRMLWTVEDLSEEISTSIHYLDEGRMILRIHHHQIQKQLSDTLKVWTHLSDGQKVKRTLERYSILTINLT